MARSFNSDSLQSLPNQWELVVIDAFVSSGDVNYEPDTGGSTVLDAVVEMHGPADDGTPMAIEITAVSDRHLRELNPLDDFIDTVVKRLRELGGPREGLRYEVGSRVDKIGNKSKVVLALPKRRDWNTFIKNELDPFLRAIAGGPALPHEIGFETQIVHLKLTYEPGRQFIGGSYGGWNVDSFVTESSFAKALDEKARQIRRSGFVGPSIIVICDAGAPLFGQASTYYTLTPAKVVDSFLNNHPEVSAVAILSARSYQKVSPALDLRPNPGATRPLPPDALSRVGDVLAQLPRTMVGVQNVRYLLHRFRGRHGLWFYHRGISLRRSEKGGDVVIGRISAKELISVLGGSAENLSAFVSRQLHPNVFHDAVRLGDQLVDVRLVRSPDADDDWIEFEFHGKDPAWTPIEPE